MPTYRMVYGDDQQVVRETFDDVDLEQEDGWTVLFRGSDAILRQDEHVQSLELLESMAATGSSPWSPSWPTVGDLMRPAVMSVERTAHLAAATYLMKKASDSALVVCADATHRVPIAVITDADVWRVVAEGKDPNNVRISDLVGRTPITVPPGMDVAEAARIMLDSHIRHLPVVDGSRLIGIIDMRDASRGLLMSRRA